MGTFTWILVLPLLQLFSVTVYAFDESIVCGALPLKDCLLLYPRLSERPNATRVLNIVPSATLIRNSERPEIIQVFSDPKDWEKIQRYAVNRGFYLGHVARRVDRNSELPELEQVLSTRYKPRSLAVNEPVGDSIDQDSVEGRGDHGEIVERSSGTETSNNEQRFQRLVRETDETTDESEDGNKKDLKRKGAENKRKTLGKDSRKKLAKNSVSKTGRRNDDATSESPLEGGAVRCKDHETTGRSSKMQKGSGTKNAKSRSGRSIADLSEIEGRLRVARDDSDADDSTLGPDEPEIEPRKHKGGDKKAKGLGSGKRGNVLSKGTGSRSASKTTEAPTKRKMSGALAKKKALCKKGGKRCELADEEDVEEEFTLRTDDDLSAAETDEEMDKTMEEVGESRQDEHLKFLDCPPMIPPEPLGKLADYFHRIFKWIKELETSGLRG